MKAWISKDRHSESGSFYGEEKSARRAVHDKIFISEIVEKGQVTHPSP
jgi:hypothetical protein